MGEFSDAALEIAEAFNSDLAEQTISFTYTEIADGTTHSYRGIQDHIKHYEIDNESVYAHTLKLFCLNHELPITPAVDDTITVSGRVCHIVRVDPADNVVGWYLYANG